MTGQRIQQEAICYQWFKQRLILSVSKPRISQRSQIKEDAVEPSVPAREFNLKAYAPINWHNDSASLGLEPRLADHRSQAAHTATLPTAPPRQACNMPCGKSNFSLAQLCCRCNKWQINYYHVYFDQSETLECRDWLIGLVGCSWRSWLSAARSYKISARLSTRPANATKLSLISTTNITA